MSKLKKKPTKRELSTFEGEESFATKTATELLLAWEQNIDTSMDLALLEVSLMKIPPLVKMLELHAIQMFEENADTSINALVRDYLILKRDNNLHELFIAAYFDRTGVLEGTEWL